MMGNDLDNKPTPRYYVMAEVVFDRFEEKQEVVEGRFFKHTTQRTFVTWVPNMTAMSELWKFAGNHAIRLELVFLGDLVQDAPELWDALDKATSNPFNDWHAFEHEGKVISILPYRPDLLGVIDIPQRATMYGGKGMTMLSLR